MAERPTSKSKKPVRDVAAIEEGLFLKLAEVAQLGRHIDTEDTRLRGLLEPVPGVVDERTSDVWRALQDLHRVRGLIRTGFRRFEFCAITVGDFEQGGEAKLWTVGKGNLRNYTPLPYQSAEAIESWLRLKVVVGEDVGPGAPMFCGRNGEFMSYELLRQAWQRVLSAAGLPAYKLHASRHTAGLIVYAATGDLKMVSRFLRHQNTDVTRRVYEHVDPAHLRRELERSSLWA